VVVAEYASAAGLTLLGMLFWDPAFSGCDASCPANLLLVRGSRPAWDAVKRSAAVGAALTVTVVVLIIRHWRSARGWSRQAMVPLVWIAVVIGAESLITNVTGLYRLPPLANLVFNGWAPLVSLLGPVLFVISTVRAGRHAARSAPRSSTWNRARPRGGSGTRWPGRWATRRCSWPSRTATASPTPRAWRWTRPSRIRAGRWSR
jgi:hypothetical protein